MNGFGSMTSQGSRSDRRTLPACRSVASSTSMGAVRGNSLKRRRPSRTNPGSGHHSMLARVSLLQWSISMDRGRKGCGAGGERQRRRRRPAITRSCSGSGSARSFGAKLIVGVEKSHRRISVPEPERLDFVLAFHMRHAELQCGGCPVPASAARILIRHAERQKTSGVPDPSGSPALG